MYKELLLTIREWLKKIFTSRLFIFAAVVIFLMAFLVVNLFQIQIVEGESYQEDYISQTLTTVKLDSSRGVIYDRNGVPLAYNELTYAITVMDTGTYNGYERNLILLKLRDILAEHGEEVLASIPIGLDENGNYVYTAASEARRLGFLRDVFGLKDVSELDTEEENRSEATAQEIVDLLTERYGIGKYGSGSGSGTYELTREETLDLIYMRYSMALNSYQSYLAATVAQDVDLATVADVMEHINELDGVNVEEEYIRVYDNGEYFANIIGYIGQADSEELEALQTDDTDYSTGDLIGKTGIESTMEAELKGSKGERTMYVDTQGHIMEVVEETEPIAGNDIYLTIDSEEQIAIYNILEQQLASILVSKIVNSDFTITSGMSASEMYISIYDVYYQLINNNVLSISHFNSSDASETEKGIYSKYQTRKTEILSLLSENLTNPQSGPISEENEKLQSYISYAFDVLTDNNILVMNRIDPTDSVYREYQNGECSFREFLFHALTNGWVDTEQLDLQQKYSSTEDTYAALIQKLEEILDTDTSFTKQIYRYLIDDRTLEGWELCIALFDQGVLAYNEEDYEKLLTNGSETAYNFMLEKIENIEITPAQLALDPCSGSVVVTDVNTGEVLAMVSYPGYDNNLLMSSSEYYMKISTDQSLPLYPRVTQTRTAPGSIFKMVTAMAGMEEGVLQPTETIETHGIFTELGLNLKCHVYPGNHGTIGIKDALTKSCNYFFSEVGYRLSLDSSGNYNASLGLERIQEYAEDFGLGERSGVEIYEISPHVTDENPVPSAIGQGSHSYTNTQYNRYTVALATRGTVLDLNLISHIDSASGETLVSYDTEILWQLDYEEEYWDVVQEGMRQVITDGSYADLFSTCPVTVAGKTGTAEESAVRAPHANFICYAPSENPEIAVSVNIPNGYTAANAVQVAKYVLDYHYGALTLDDILDSGASSANSSIVDENE